MCFSDSSNRKHAPKATHQAGLGQWGAIGWKDELDDDDIHQPNDNYDIHEALKY